MKSITFALIVFLGIAGLAGCASHEKSKVSVGASSTVVTAPAGTNAWVGPKDRISYAIGMSLGYTFKVQDVELDPEVFIRGVKDMMNASNTTLLTMDEMRNTLAEYQKELANQRQQLLVAMGMTNKQVSAAFMATNKNNPGVITLPDGLQYIVITNGSGDRLGTNDLVTINYRGFTLDGKEYDSSFKHSRPSQFPVSNMLHGWAEALRLMNVGSKWKVFIPPDLAFGERAVPGVMPNSVVIVEMELLSIDHPKPPEPITSDIVKVPSLAEMQKGAKIEVIKPGDAAKAQASTTNAPPK